MNKRVFLLNPPSRELTRSVPLGLAYLSAVLRREGYDVKVLDAAARYNPKGPEDIIKAIKEHDPLFIGVALRFDFISEKYELLRRLKGLGYPVIVGGPHANIMPEEALEHGADVVCIGEGEDTVLEFASAVSGKRGLEGISGLGFRGPDGKIVFTPPRKPRADLDEIPFPDYSDYDFRDYLGTGDHTSDRTFFDVFTARGCPHRCTYCSASRVWKGGQRRRSASNVYGEIRYLVEKFGAKYIAFMDNEPLVDKERVFELCDLLEKGGLGVKISTRARIDNIDEKVLRRMMEVGFYKIAIGVESGDDETLKKVNRFYTQDDVLKAMEVLEKVKFPCIHFNNLVGFPWETKKHFDSTRRLNRRMPGSLTYFVNVITPYPMPGTPLYDDYVEKYGFKDWWLDSEQYACIDGIDSWKPFFRSFMPMLSFMYYKIDFWKYPDKVKKEIRDIQLELQRVAYSKNKSFSSVELAAVFFLIRLSVRLYLFSPRLESIVFAPLKNKAMLDYSKKYVFKDQ